MNTEKKESNHNSKEELEFEVMPQSDSTDLAESPSFKKPSSKILVPEKKSSNRKLRVWVISILAILLLFVAGYLSYIYFFRSDVNQEGKTRVNVPSGDVLEQDSDNDGLSDERERELGTDPDDPDSDRDGLSDGDEVNIYKSDPLLEDSDLDTFLDGDEVSRGFSPIVNTLEKASDEEKRSWSEGIVKHGLHEPTKTTISKSETEDVEVQSESKYTNSAFQYQTDIPDSLEVRESTDKSTVGFYVKGTTPSDDNPGNDIITISIAIKPADQTLVEWGETFLVEGESYGSRVIVDQEDFLGVKYLDLKAAEGQCPLNQVHFSKLNDSKVFAITLSCNESEEFISLFEEIVSAFNFGD